MRRKPILEVALIVPAILFWMACGSGSGTTPAPVVSASYLYVANSGSDTISGFQRDKNSGQLTRVLGSPFTISPSLTPLALALYQDKYLIAVNQDSYNTSVFGVGSNGTLSQVSGSPFTDFGGMHTGVAVHPSGKFVYLTIHPGGIVAVQVNASTGTVTVIPGSPFGFSDEATPIIDASGKYLYAVNFGSIDAFSINPTTGVLTRMSGAPFGSMNAVTDMTIDPSGKYLLAVEGGYVYMHTFSVDSASGALQEVEGSPYYRPLFDPFHIMMEPSGKFAFAANTTRGTISSFQMDPVTGLLTWLGEVNAGTFPSQLTMDVEGKFLYVSNYRSDNVSAYAIDQTTGALTEISGSPYAAGSFPEGLAATK